MPRRSCDPGRRRGLRCGLTAHALLAYLALGAGAANASGGPEPQVQIHDFRFDPPTLEVPAGATVTWVNRDEEIHTVKPRAAPRRSAPASSTSCR